MAVLLFSISICVFLALISTNMFASLAITGDLTTKLAVALLLTSVHFTIREETTDAFLAPAASFFSCYNGPIQPFPPRRTLWMKAEDAIE
jgi:hypothetical protein